MEKEVCIATGILFHGNHDENTFSPHSEPFNQKSREMRVGGSQVKIFGENELAHEEIT